MKSFNSEENTDDTDGIPDTSAQRQIDRQQRRPKRTPGMGIKNLERRVRNRRFKIKAMVAQPKNVEVKRNGKIVRKMVVRRSTIYPAEVRRAYY